MNKNFCDMELIDKSALVAEIKSLMRTTFTNFDEGVNCAAQTLLEIIDTLEVKEVNEPTAADKGIAEEIIFNLKRVEKDYYISLAKEITWLRNKLQLNTLEVKEVNVAEMADDYYDALMKEAAVWMDEGTMRHCRLAYYNGCKDVLNKIQKGE